LKTSRVRVRQGQWLSFLLCKLAELHYVSIVLTVLDVMSGLAFCVCEKNLTPTTQKDFPRKPVRTAAESME